MYDDFQPARMMAGLLALVEAASYAVSKKGGYMGSEIQLKSLYLTWGALEYDRDSIHLTIPNLPRQW